MKRSKKMFTVMLALCVALSMAMASVTANAATKKPKKIYLKATSTTVDVKGKVKVSVYKVKPSKASKSVKWKSSNKKIATVSKSGYVTGKKKGTVKITATSKKNKRAKKTIKIKVKDLKAKSVTMSKKSMDMFVTKKATLKATVKGPTGFYNQGVTWKSSNTNIATVDSKGNVVAKSEGSATITATEKGGSKKATCAVTVSKAPTGVTVDTNNETVTVEAVVGSNEAKARHTYLCYYKGAQANNSVLVTGVTPKQLADALNELSATPWNNNETVPAAFQTTGKKTIEALAADGTGNKNYTKVDVSVKYGDTTITMQDSLKDVKVDDNFSMVYANVGNDANEKFGCLTCTNGCWSGVVANAKRLTGKDFVPQKMPAEGTKVTVTYTLQNNYISEEDLQKDANDYVLLDVRAKDAYDDAHIAGAISTPVDINSQDMDESIKNIVADKGTDKKYALICYSGNRYAKKAAKDLRACEVTNGNIEILTGGMGAWRSAGYEVDHYNYTNADTTFSKMKDSSYVILDARKAADYDNGHIAGAVSADVGYYIDNQYSSKDAAEANVKAVVDKYDQNKDKKYIVICYSGNRYAKVATGLLMNYGIENANIQTLGGDDSQRSDAGGMKAWNAKYESYVVAKHTSSGNFNFANGITPENLKADVEGQKVFTVMDVRAKEDYDKGHISNAVSAPSSDDEAVMKAVNDNPNGLYVLVCYSGNSKADAARNTMVKNGVDESRIICLQDGMGTWK
mgnify:FL=1